MSWQAWVRRYTPPLILISLLIAAWHFLVELNNIKPNVLPSPGRVIVALIDFWDVIWGHTLQTLLETFVGFSVALAVGFLFALLLDNSAVAKQAVYPLLVASQTIPLVAIAPLLIIWFGFDIVPKIIIVWLVCFFPITVGAVDGFASTDQEASRLFKSMGAKRWQIFWFLRLPSALPNLFSGIRIAVTYSVTGAIFGEYVGAEKGLGIFIQRSKNSFRNDLVFAAVLVTAILSVLLFLSVALIQRWVMPWYFAMRSEKLSVGRGRLRV